MEWMSHPSEVIRSMLKERSRSLKNSFAIMKPRATVVSSDTDHENGDMDAAPERRMKERSPVTQLVGGTMDSHGSLPDWVKQCVRYFAPQISDATISDQQSQSSVSVESSECSRIGKKPEALKSLERIIAESKESEPNWMQRLKMLWDVEAHETVVDQNQMFDAIVDDSVQDMRQATKLNRNHMIVHGLNTNPEHNSKYVCDTNRVPDGGDATNVEEQAKHISQVSHLCQLIESGGVLRAGPSPSHKSLAFLIINKSAKSRVQNGQFIREANFQQN